MQLFAATCDSLLRLGIEPTFYLCLRPRVCKEADNGNVGAASACLPCTYVGARPVMPYLPLRTYLTIGMYVGV